MSLSCPPPVPQRFLVESLYGLLASNARPTTAAYNLPREGLLQVGGWAERGGAGQGRAERAPRKCSVGREGTMLQIGGCCWWGSW